jgi:hypothetical protein
VTPALDTRSPFDPEGFDADLEPAVVHLASGDEVLVAHHEPAAGGWLSLVGWGGSRVLLPPGRVALVEPVETATGGALDTRQRIVDEELRAEVESVVENGAPALAEGLAAMQCGNAGEVSR